MNKSDLNKYLEFIDNPEGELQIIIYANLKGESTPKKLDIKENDLAEIKQIFINGIKSNILEKENHSILNLSSADERKDCFYLYDLEVPEKLSFLEKVIGNDSLPNFSFKENNLSDIDSLIIVLADNDSELSLYKKLSAVEIIGRGGYIIKRANHRLERMEDQLLRITGKFQVIRVNGETVIIDLNTIEKSLGLHDVIIKEASASLNIIRNMSLVSNIESLQELIDNVSFARKLTKVAKSSPVIKKNIPNNNIIHFSKVHPFTKNRMRYNEEETKFELDTRVSKDLFVKILNDDLLTSELTKLYYDSLAKDGIKVENESQEVESID